MFSPFESPMLPLNMVQSSLNHVLLSTQIHEHSQIISHPHVSPQKKKNINSSQNVRKIVENPPPGNDSMIVPSRNSQDRKSSH